MAGDNTGAWVRNERGDWVAPAESATDAVERVFADPHTTEERLEAVRAWIMETASFARMPRRLPAPPADFNGREWRGDAVRSEQPGDTSGSELH